MEKYGLNELREMFLSYFESKGHLRLPSFSLIPQNDASLLLINSGMAPMKPWFKGEQEPPRRRVTTCQKCIRTGDIENIGKTDRHGTYFEMLGNFSFGDYFKHEAISYCWEFLTDVVGIPADRLYPSIYVDDDEAFEIWNKEIGIAPERIFRFGKEDNFWEHGSGPCGPCSEVYFDRGPEHGCGSPDCTVGCECDRYIEVWNNVFSQFDNDGNNNYTELAQKNIDTGMGLERLAVVCQGVNSLFDVDTVMNITNKVSELTGATYGQSTKIDVSLRVITDHIRSATMMIADGVRPSNEGRGYVLRRLIRRAARHGKLLGVSGAFLYDVCHTVVEENKGAYPELIEKEDYITKVLRVEEENFAKTIDGGMNILNGLIAEYKEKNETVFSGDDAFKLYDTYGFPIDLTIEIVAEQGMTVDMDGFNKQMEEQRVRAREARAALGDLAWAGIDFGLDNTPTEFTGYTNCSEDAKILAMAADGEVCSMIREGEEGIIVLDKTPMYAEMGGQVADHGVITTAKGEFKVNNVQKDKGGKYLHHGIVTKGELTVDELAKAEIDTIRRKAIMRAHSATHLAQKALQQVLGDHVQQAGSLVEPDKLRFDFTHFSPMTAEEIAKVNEMVRDMVFEGYDVDVREMPIEEARQQGAMALFGEKYGEVVRVVNMGGVSIELCGGTHLDNTAKVGSFKIISEFSVASGVRRIEAVTGKEYVKRMEENEALVHQVAEILKTSPADLQKKAAGYMAEMREMRQNIDKLNTKLRAGEIENFLVSAKKVGELKVFTTIMNDATADDLKKAGDIIRDKEENIVAVLASANGPKLTILAVCGKGAIKAGVKAGELVKKVCSICGGSGGGKPDMAMGGGKDALKLDDAFAVVDDFVAEKQK
ncbi:MAG: alanine--tRNA ligase [Ruminococcaceae bacterium]|nr:alanine--tRNA ligase [Oscillospiraceae bacterium]